MPRNAGNVYSKPPGTTPIVNDDVDPVPFNLLMDDIATDLNTPRPIVAGGTGASSAAAALVNLGLTATAAEINTLDGITASTAELNILDGVTATTAELNILDGVTATASEINALDGVTATGTSVIQAADAAAARTALEIPENRGYTFSAAQTTSSGTSFDFTGIPSYAREVIVMLRDVSLSGTDNILVQLGDSGGIETSGYNDTIQLSEGTNINVSLGGGTGFTIGGGNASNAMTGTMRIYKPLTTAEEWIADATVRRGAQFALVSGYKALSAILTQVRVTRTGTNTFDGGYLVVGWR
jgi:hypothetical protein